MPGPSQALVLASLICSSPGVHLRSWVALLFHPRPWEMYLVSRLCPHISVLPVLSVLSSLTGLFLEAVSVSLRWQSPHIPTEPLLVRIPVFDHNVMLRENFN